MGVCIQLGPDGCNGGIDNTMAGGVLLLAARPPAPNRATLAR
jgi:hypothetical protein